MRRILRASDMDQVDGQSDLRAAETHAALANQQNGSSFMRFLHFMVAGGWGMWLVLACGLISVWQATVFAKRPAPVGRDAVTAFSRGTLMSIPAATGLSLAHMGAKVPSIPELANNPRFDLVVIQGLAEALSPSILGFSILCAVWLITAIGERRLSYDGGDLGN